MGYPQNPPPDLDPFGMPTTDKPPDLDPYGNPSTDSYDVLNTPPSSGLTRGLEMLDETGLTRSFTNHWFQNAMRDYGPGESLYRYGETHPTALGKLAFNAGAIPEAIGHGIDEFATPLNIGTLGIGELASIAGLGRIGMPIGSKFIGLDNLTTYPTAAKALTWGTRIGAAPMAASGANRLWNAQDWQDRVLGGGEALLGILGLRSKIPSIAGDVKVPETSTSTGPRIPLGFENLGIKQNEALPSLVYPNTGDNVGLTVAKQLGYEPTGTINKGRVEMRLTQQAPQFSLDASGPTTLPKNITREQLSTVSQTHDIVGRLQSGELIAVPKGMSWKPNLDQTFGPPPEPPARPQIIRLPNGQYARADSVDPALVNPPTGGGIPANEMPTNMPHGPTPEERAAARPQTQEQSVQEINAIASGNASPAIPGPTATTPIETENPFGLDVPPTVTPDAVQPTTVEPPKMGGGIPESLASFKGAFKLGPDAYTPTFANDVDKAAYMISSPTRPPNTEVLKYVMDATGLDQTNAIAYGRRVRNAVTNAAKEADTAGELQIPAIGPQGKGMGILERFLRESTGSYDPLKGWQNFKNAFVHELPQPTKRGEPNYVRDAQGNIVKDATTGKPMKIHSIPYEIFNASRSTLPGADLSAPLRQGLPLILSKRWWEAWKPMMDARRSEEGYNAVMAGLKSMDIFKDTILSNGQKMESFASQIGVKLTDVNHLNGLEESIASQWAEKAIPGIRASNRAYTAYLNVLRAQTLNDLLQEAELAGHSPRQNMVLAKQIGDFVMTATGRGPLRFGGPAVQFHEGKGIAVGTKEYNMESIAQPLTYAFFAPRLLASRARMFNPWTYTMTQPFVRRQYIKAMLGTAMAWGTMSGTMKLLGADVSLNPTSADFGKARFGDTRMDPAGGFQQYLTAFIRFATGIDTTAASDLPMELGQGYRAPTRFDIGKQFLSNKLHPVVKLGYDLINASSQQPVYMTDRIAQTFIPLLWQDMIGAATDDQNKFLRAALLPLVAVGMGTQTYEARGDQSTLLPGAKNWDYGFTGGQTPLANIVPGIPDR